MSTAYTLITYGGGETLTAIFNAIAAGTGDSSFSTALRLAGLMGFVWVIAQVALTQNPTKLMSWFGSFYLLINLMLVPKMTVLIEDKLRNDTVTTVDNVPVGVGYFATMASQIGYYLQSTFDKLFSLPNDLQYSKTGLVMGSRLVSDAMQFQITDSDFSRNMDSFMQQCVFYDLLLKKYTMADLLSSTNIWNFVTQYASPARAFRYDSRATSTIYTCQTGVNQLNQDWQREINQAATVYGQRFFATSDVSAKSELLSRLPNAMSYLSGVSAGATQIMQQAMLANAVDHALVANSSQVNAGAAVQQYASVRFDQMMRSKFLVMGENSGSWLLIAKNVIEALLYGSFFIVVLTMLLPSGYRVVLSYFQSILWVQLWSPLYAVLNLIMTLGAKNESLASIADVSGRVNGISLNTYAGLAKVNADMAAFAGYATVLIPLVSWGLVKLTGLAVTAIASQFSSIAQSAAARVSEEMTTGNLSYGNVQYANQSAFNTSANHFNTNASYQSGMTAYQAPSGAMISHTNNGTDVIDGRAAISSTATNINLADSMRAQASLQADQATTAGVSHMRAFSQSMSSAFRGIYELGQTFGQSANSDQAWGINHSDSAIKSAESVQQQIKAFAQSHNLSHDEATRIVGEAYAQGSIGTGFGKIANASAGGRLHASASGGATDTQTFRDAQDLVKQDSFRSSIDNIVRHSHDSNFRTGNERADRLVKQTGSAYDNAMALRDETASSFSQADSYRKTASYASENAVSINTNTNQLFTDWVSHQPSEHGTSLGVVGAESILNGDPNLSREYANQFVSSEVNKLAGQFTQHTANSTTLAAQYNQNNTSMPSEQQVLSHAALDMQMTNNAAMESGLDKSQLNRSISAKVEKDFTGNEKIIANDLKKMVNEENIQQNTVESTLNNNDKSLLHQAAIESAKIVKNTL